MTRSRRERDDRDARDHSRRTQYRNSSRSDCININQKRPMVHAVHSLICTTVNMNTLSKFHLSSSPIEPFENGILHDQ